MNQIRTLALLALMSICAFAQVNVNGDRKFLGSVDASEAQVTKPFREVLTVPSGSCANPGQMVQLTLSARLFLCNGTWQEISGSGSPGAVSSVFGRTGPVTAQAGDYAAFYPSLSGSYENPSWINSLAWSKLTGVPSSFTPSAHTQTASTITDFATASRALFSAGSGLSYNEATGVWSCTGCSGGPVSVEWNDVLNKPLSYPPSAHTQVASTITDFLEAARLAYTGEGCIDLNPTTGVITYTCSPAIDWGDIDNKPDDFPPAPHTHQPSDVFEVDLGTKLIDRALGIDETVVPLFYSGSAAPTTGEANRFYFRSNGSLYYFVAEDAPIQLVNLSQLAAHATRALLSGDIPNNAANTSGNAATASALASTPTICSSGQAPRGVLANGNATGCQSVSGGGASFLAVSTPNGSVAASTTSHSVFIGRSSAAWGTAGSFNIVMPVSGTVSNCNVAWRTQQVSGGNLVITLLKNGTATGITFTITNADGASGIKSDSLTSVSFDANDTLAWEGANAATSISALIASLACKVAE